jgi:hypothetical protein
MQKPFWSTELDPQGYISANLSLDGAKLGLRFRTLELDAYQLDENLTDTFFLEHCHHPHNTPLKGPDKFARLIHPLKITRYARDTEGGAGSVSKVLIMPVDGDEVGRYIALL